jgi:hypothetical protein
VLDWNLLFLIPLPWWGPVLAPCCIATLMIMGGTLVTQFIRDAKRLWPGGWAWMISFCGAAVALYVFMTDTLHAVSQGVVAVRNVLPASFNWSLFMGALVLMAMPVLQVMRKVWQLKAVASQTAEAIGRKGPLRVFINRAG